MAVAFLVLAVLIGALVLLFMKIPTSFVPNEDQGYVMALVAMPDAASLDRTVRTADNVDALFAAHPAVLNRAMINGYSLIDGQFKANASTAFVTLKDFEERYSSIARAKKENPRALLQAVHAGSKDIKTGVVIPIAPPPIPGIGTTGGFEFWIQDKGSGDPARLYEVTQQFLARAGKRPELSGLNSTFRASSRQLHVEVDREKAVLLGVPVQDVYSAIQAQFGSLVASQYNEYSRIWNVVLQSDSRFRQDPSDLARLYARSNSGRMIPLSTAVKTSYSMGPDLLPHFNGFPAAQVTGSAAEGYSSGDAI